MYNSSIINPDALDPMNYYGKKCTPFLFIIDFLAQKPYIAPLSNLAKSVLYDFNGFTNHTNKPTSKKQLRFEKFPVSYSLYKQAFDCVHNHLFEGNSYLVNLTFPTPINTNYSLYEIFCCSNAPFRILFDDVVVFSPEAFVIIKDGYIYTFPMKGTIDATIPNAKEILLNDEKEFAEHITVVDLLRNDLAKVSHSVCVEDFRYCSTVNTHTKTLLQTSSAIKGKLYPHYNEHLGSIFAALLPAGSVTGAPKKKTVEIIQQAEIYNRGYYTGVCGYFDGQSVVSAVMIRFIESCTNGLIFKSGGGITIYSNPEDEYNEMIEKVYVPIN
ncbi:MAG: aminodeoxychorismate synthase component I [Spirochaetes bacterium]|nr:aminodeoxychorismate synthase component I [Spirochaetota bacterium]